jgi:hypothetical protein
MRLEARATLPPKRAGKAEIKRVFGFSGSREREFDVGVGIRIRLAVRATGAAGHGASAKRLIDDGLDGARATAAFGAAAEAAIDLLGITRQIFRRGNGAADIVVG